jgi:hypothetical protein
MKDFGVWAGIRPLKLICSKPILIAILLSSVISIAITFAVLTQWPLTIKMRVGGTDFVVYELAEDLTRLGEAHEHDFEVLAEYDPVSWFIEIENLSPWPILVNYTIVGLPANFTVELTYDFDGFDMPMDWVEDDQLEVQSAGEYKDVIVKIKVTNRGAEPGAYSFNIDVHAV